MIYKISRNSFCNQFVWLVTLILFTDTTLAYQRGPNSPHSIEVFTSAKYPIANLAGSNVQGSEITVYEIDGIQSVERDLSLNLPADPQQSKQFSLQRIQDMDNQARVRMQRSAIGLAKAMQYGISRYPAIVFDGQAVVYGVTDLLAALAYYQVWQTGDKP
jgi:integrating conjugative element protein (TIGR03757 family)